MGLVVGDAVVGVSSAGGPGCDRAVGGDVSTGVPSPIGALVGGDDAGSFAGCLVGACVTGALVG